jgi:glycosyltransferase involved in cell wall biosynthesis
MDISVIICTWNRSALLDQTLTEMRKLEIPPGVEWELLVVNNNCSDDTDEVITRHGPYLPIRRLFEATPGKSFAANLALSHAKGDLLLWTDDDALVDPDWLGEYVKAVREWPDVMYFGGPVEPWFAVEPPKWIRRNIMSLDCVYAIRRMGPVTRLFEQFELPYGVNMAMRRQAFDGVSFDTRIGPRGNTQVRGEETALIEQFKKLGYRGLWVATARLHHYIPQNRLTYKYIWSFFVGYGKTLERLEGPRDGKFLFGAPRWAVKHYVLHSAKALLLSPFKGQQWLRAVRKAARAKGIIVEARARFWTAELIPTAAVTKPSGPFESLHAGLRVVSHDVGKDFRRS